MKNLIFFLLLTLLFPVFSLSQSCLPDGIIFRYQSQIDSFQYNYPGCNEIEGSVIIRGLSYNGNLSGLSQITSIGGSLKIYHNHDLSSLSGLDNLIHVGGDLIIGIDWVMEGNENLINLQGLNNLLNIGGILSIANNSRLDSITELSSLSSIGGDLSIVRNDVLKSLSGLENITYS